MINNYSISVYLDKRRKKKTGKYPVKLRVYSKATDKIKLYSTVFNLTENEFSSVWNTAKPRKEYKDLQKKIQAVETRAENVAKKLDPFTFEQFERILYRKAGDGIKVKYHYDQIINEFEKRGQVGTASTYNLSRKSIIEFVGRRSGQNFYKLTLHDITPGWLKDYESYMTEEKGKSLTTVSIYLRALRAVFNKAISEKEIEKEFYPFGKRKYQVPATRNVKKALSNEQLKAFYQLKPASQEQAKAKDFWFFSYACNGMNIKDIALLKYKDIQDGKVEFYRAKTRITSKANLRPVVAFLNDFTTGIIEKYGNTDKSLESYVFKIVEDGMTPKEQQIKIKAFTRFINQHIKKLCKANGLPEQISTYWARHSFTTNAIRKGASMAFIQESLGHNDMKTTLNYFAGFDSDTKKEFAKSIMDFD